VYFDSSKDKRVAVSHTEFYNLSIDKFNKYSRQRHKISNGVNQFLIFKQRGEIASVRRGVNEIFAPMRWRAASSGTARLLGLEDETDRLSRNVGNKSSTHAA